MAHDTPCIIRPYNPADAAQIAALFFNTIHAVNRRDYTPEQVAAWAGDGVGAEQWWSAKLATRATFVAATGDKVVGFADVEPDGHLDHLFVHHQHQRQGIAAALHNAIEAEARRAGAPRLFTEASLTARPFFLRMGYRQLRQQQATCRGIPLTNFAMEKQL